MADPYRVLVVGTTNVCRSPAVERYLLHRLGPQGDVEVSSAGVVAEAGAPITPSMGVLMSRAGLATKDFTARQLTETMVLRAELVLTLDRGHRSTVVQLVPAAVRRTFTLRELVRLARAMDRSALPDASAGERLRASHRLLLAGRGARPVEPREDDVRDPDGRGDSAHRASWAQLREAVDALVDVVAPALVH